MAQPPKKSGQAPAPAAPARRRSPRREREERRQRQIVILSAAAIGLALLAVLSGVLYDQAYVPSQTVARVNGATLSRGDYWRERRNDSAASISQALFLTSFGPQFAQQALSQIGSIDSGIAALKTEAVDDTVVTSWTEQQLVLQGAQQMGLQATDGEVAQLIDSSYGPSFGPPPPAPEGTPTAAPTQPPPTAAPTLAPTVTPGGPTLTPLPTTTLAPTFTPAPTTPPTVTPQAAEAQTRVDQVYSTLYSRYMDQLIQIDPTRKPKLTLDDFKAGLRAQFTRQVLTNKIEEKLVPDASFTPSTDPSAIDARHILIAVTVPVSATQQQIDDAFAAKRPAAEALLKQVRDGADFAKLAEQSSDDYNTRPQGGSLPSFDKTGKTNTGSQIDPAIVAAVAPLKENEVSDLVRTPFGWHIVQLVKRTVDPREQQLSAARTKEFDAWLAKQREAAKIERFPAVSPTPTLPPTGTALPLPTVELHGQPSPTPLASPTPIGTPAATPAPGATSAPTSTPAATSAPTATGAPTSTPAATATPTP